MTTALAEDLESVFARPISTPIRFFMNYMSSTSASDDALLMLINSVGM